ncbi:MAG: GNAT family N-acetyltransferase [Bryobacterales bacterium]|nr:GNAT family N-acetyltransferase [Bryobacterales bacterium]
MSKPHVKSPVEPAHSLFGRERYPLDVFFKPDSVAVIGATEAPGSVGRTTLWNLISSPFGGTVYPVNPKRSSVLGVRAYPSVREVPEAVDLAVVVTPAQTVPGIIRECVDAGVKGAIVLAAGFRELGPRGEALEQQALEEARKGALRIIGPNCLGVMCPTSGLNATFANAMARQGTVAFLSQSGALCTAVLDWSHRELVGFSAFVSIGSMADVGWGDLIDYLGNDARTRSILIYMESVGDARSFLSAAREVALTKPVIVIKAGRTAEGARAAAAHTGAVPGRDDVLDAALRRCGVLRVSHISDLFYMAEVLSKQPRPQGKRLAIVTNAGGPAVLATDMLITGGGDLAPLSEDTMAALNQALPSEWSHANPIDILGDAKPERFAKVVEIVAKDPNSDGILVVLAPQANTDPTETAEQMKPFAKLGKKPILASWMGGVDVAGGVALLRSAEIPTFAYPDTAVRMFLYMGAYTENLQGIYETPLMEAADEGMAEARAILDARASLSGGEARELLAAYGISLPEDSPLAVGSFVDERFGPVVFMEGEWGERVYGLPPLTTSLAAVVLERLQTHAQISEQREMYLRLLVRLGRLIVEHPRIRNLRIAAGRVELELYPPEIPAGKLPKPAIRPYPVEYAGDWQMKNGERVSIRPIRPEDEPLIVQFHQTLGDRTVYFRYLSALKLSTRIAHERLIRICFIDYTRQMALVVERENPQTGAPEIIAVGRLAKDMQAFARGRREAEFALVVSDSFQGQGLGKELLRRLLRVARDEGVETVFGEISAENAPMQAICRGMGFQIQRDFEDTTVVARMNLKG